MVTDAYRYAVICQAVGEHEICQAFAALRAANIDPILLKGWSVARHYPDPALRPLGDLDLLVRDEELLASKQAFTGYIDWHTVSGLRAEFNEPEEVVRRSQLVPLLDNQIRVLCLEDNLHYVAIHMLSHGAWSPQWVQDVAALVQSRPPNFDWDICLGQDATRAEWVRTALILARDLRGADISGTPGEHHCIPGWLVPAVRKAWQNPDPAGNQPPESIWTALTHPWRLPNALSKRWPSPIAAAIRTRVPFSQRFPIQHQLRCYTDLTRAFVRRSGRPVTEQRP